MKNKTKLILSNAFALLAVVLILVGTKLMGMDLGNLSGSILPKALLIVVPQMGFIYFYLTSYKLESKKAVA
jgi:hypothetical protein